MHAIDIAVLDALNAGFGDASLIFALLAHIARNRIDIELEIMSWFSAGMACGISITIGEIYLSGFFLAISWLAVYFINKEFSPNHFTQNPALAGL